MAQREMTYRVVALASAAASDTRLGPTVHERVEMVAALSRAAWTASGRLLPSYARADMPLRLSTLDQQGSDAE